MGMGVCWGPTRRVVVGWGINVGGGVSYGIHVEMEGVRALACWGNGCGD